MQQQITFSGDQVATLVLFLLTAGFLAAALICRTLVERAIDRRKEAAPADHRELGITARLAAGSTLILYLITVHGLMFPAVVVPNLPADVGAVVATVLPERTWGLVLLLCYSGLLSIFIQFREEITQHIIDHAERRIGL